MLCRLVCHAVKLLLVAFAWSSARSWTDPPGAEAAEDARRPEGGWRPSRRWGDRAARGERGRRLGRGRGTVAKEPRDGGGDAAEKEAAGDPTEWPQGAGTPPSRTSARDCRRRRVLQTGLCACRAGGRGQGRECGVSGGKRGRCCRHGHETAGGTSPLLTRPLDDRGNATAAEVRREPIGVPLDGCGAAARTRPRVNLRNDRRGASAPLRTSPQNG